MRNLAVLSRVLHNRISNNIKNYKSNQPTKRYLSKRNTTDDEAFGPTWRSVTITGIVGLTVFGIFYYINEKEKKEKLRNRYKSLGKMALGGDYELINHNNVKVTNKDFLGHWIVLYFGFCHCPDICHEELEKLVEGLKIIDNSPRRLMKLRRTNLKRPVVWPIFISIDPDRDTVEVVKDYVQDFSSHMVGLTGSQEQVATAAKAFRVYYSKGPMDEDGDYIVDHSIVMYLVDPDGNFVDFYGRERTSSDLASGIIKHMEEYDQLED